MMEKVSDAKEMANCLVEIHLKEKKMVIENELAEKLELINSQKSTWPVHIIDDLENKASSLRDRIDDFEHLIAANDIKSGQKLQQMKKRKATQIIQEQEIKKGKIGKQGAPGKLDSEDEEFLAKCVEDTATYHGRGHDLVMYTNQRVKARDLLNIANYRRLKTGKQLIKSPSQCITDVSPKTQGHCKLLVT